MIEKCTWSSTDLHFNKSDRATSLEITEGEGCVRGYIHFASIEFAATITPDGQARSS